MFLLLRKLAQVQADLRDLWNLAVERKFPVHIPALFLLFFPEILEQVTLPIPAVLNKTRHAYHHVMSS